MTIITFSEDSSGVGFPDVGPAVGLLVLGCLLHLPEAAGLSDLLAQGGGSSGSQELRQVARLPDRVTLHVFVVADVQPLRW